MSNLFFEHPILNSPYDYPSRHWELDDQGQPTQKIISQRRKAEFITPIPKPRKRKSKGTPQKLFADHKLTSKGQQYDPTPIINKLRQEVWQTNAQRCHLNWVILDSDWEGEFCRVPDFIVLIDDGRVDPLQLIVEIKGYRREDARDKKRTMDNYWVPGVNNLQKYGRWAFAEFTEVYQIELDFKAKVESEFNKMIEKVVGH